jgi:uncharacterized membrane protein
MELNNLFGLPAHPLLVHLPVVMVPMAALGAIILAIFPKYFARFGWWVTGISFIGAIGAILAAGSGETLEERVDRSSTLRDHAEMGETARLLAVALFVVLLIVMLARKYRAADMTKKAVSIAVSVVIAVSAAAAGWVIIQTGHSGAKASWCEVTKNCPVSSGVISNDGDDDEG